MRRSYIYLGVFALFLLISGGCNCGGDVSIACKDDGECLKKQCDGDRCGCVDGKCVVVQCLKNYHCAQGQLCKDHKCVDQKPSRCTKDEDCPSGYQCIALTGQCKPVAKGCQSDQDCSGGKVCCDLDDGRGKQCNYRKCLKHDDCRTGSKNTCVQPLTCNNNIQPSCINGVCKCEEPCGGGDCGDGRCCDIQKNACVDNPKPCADLKCPPGYDPPPADKFKVDPKSCKITGPKCECIKRKPIDPGTMGSYSEIGLFNGMPVVSAYNETYGDLVVGFYQSDKSIKWEYVDGIPTNEPPTGAPDGPRGGVDKPGPDVGKYTSIAVSGQKIHVSYYDETNKALKYALKTGGNWKVHTVDKNGTGVGRFTSIALRPGGQPVIAYFTVDDGKGKSALRIAMSTKAEPTSDKDWNILTVDSVVRPNCGGNCDAKKKELCMMVSPGKYGCKAPTKDCPNKCPSGYACLNKKCVLAFPDEKDPQPPRGVGLYPSISANSGGSIAVAYFDSINGDLKVAVWDGKKFNVKAVKTKGIVGEFPSLFLAPDGKLHLSYTDVDSGDIRYLRLSPTLNIEIDEIVDNGQGGGEDHLLNDSSIALDSAGTPRIVYQDASIQALKIAIRRGTKQWEVKKLVGADTPYLGAFGFFADQVIKNNTSYISNYKINVRDPKKSSGIDIRTYPSSP